ncbi:hypothetical protein WH47_09178 [Habropoda laboriosa]|uniref:Histone-lysine N-methyltransferase SETMAR n=1 Tax=Habropoda laboriosa TaxID=597456 RepID=A0A0L7QN38_9HYME|nr:hypothetical protein WH47_09178 [Habropoda laboriosa]
MHCSHRTVLRHLKTMEKLQKLSSWISHYLSQENKNQEKPQELINQRDACTTGQKFWITVH